MNDDPAQNIEIEKERTKRTAIAIRLPGMTMIFCALVLFLDPSWPTIAGVAIICGMATYICVLLLKQPQE